MLPNLTAQEMDWLVLGELQMALERASGSGLRISGHIAARQSCDGETGRSLAPRAHTTERHREAPEEGLGGRGGILGAGGVNGHAASLPPPVSPLCSSAKCPLWGRCPDPRSDRCSWLGQPYTARKWLPDLPSKSWGMEEVGGQQSRAGLWPAMVQGPGLLCCSSLPSLTLPSRYRW